MSDTPREEPPEEGVEETLHPVNLEVPYDASDVEMDGEQPDIDEGDPDDPAVPDEGD